MDGCLLLMAAHAVRDDEDGTEGYSAPLVHALDDRARQFYEHYEFREPPGIRRS